MVNGKNTCFQIGNHGNNSMSATEIVVNRNEIPHSVPFSEVRNKQNATDRPNPNDISIRYEIQKKAKTSMNRKEVADYRMSYRQKILIDLLTGGYVSAYNIIFNIESIAQVGPSNPIRHLKLRSKDALTYAQEQLMKVEEANWKNDNQSIHQHYLHLTDYFCDYPELCGYFLNQMLSVGEKTFDDGKAMAQTHRKLGNLFFGYGNNETALEHYEKYLRISENHKEWIKDSATYQSFFEDACCLLHNFYVTRGESENLDGKLDDLLKANQYAKITANDQIIASTSLKLGIAFQQAGDYEKALSLFTDYLRFNVESNSDKELDKMVRSLSQIIPSCSEFSDLLNEVEKRLTQYISNGSHVTYYAQVCCCLGNLHNAKYDYNKAKECLELSYNWALENRNEGIFNEAKVYLSIAQCHENFPHLADILTQTDGSRQFLELRNSFLKNLKGSDVLEMD